MNLLYVLTTDAIIDTGASRSILSSLHVRMTDQEFIESKANLIINSGLGGSLKCYTHSFVVQVLSQDMKRVFWESECISLDCSKQ